MTNNSLLKGKWHNNSSNMIHIFRGVGEEEEAVATAKNLLHLRITNPPERGSKEQRANMASRSSNSNKNNRKDMAAKRTTR
mmetsp:Transcript_64203/g.133933  ORF Transcript_64203/g.133933 Transcript_64203/m.133933 type:complete len:81 (-) Transcript_64203:483-725(-)